MGIDWTERIEPVPGAVMGEDDDDNDDKEGEGDDDDDYDNDGSSTNASMANKVTADLFLSNSACVVLIMTIKSSFQIVSYHW